VLAQSIYSSPLYLNAITHKLSLILFLGELNLNGWGVKCFVHFFDLYIIIIILSMNKFVKLNGKYYTVSHEIQKKIGR